MLFTLHVEPFQPIDGADWIAWLKTDANQYVKISLPHMMDEEHARAIVDALVAGGK